MVQAKEYDRTANAYDALYTSLLQRYTDAVNQQSFPIATAQVISRAVKPGAPSSPRRFVTLVLGLIGGAGLGVVAAFARDATDQSLRHAAQIERLGVPCYAMLPVLEREPDFKRRRLALASSTSVPSQHAGDKLKIEFLLHDPASLFAQAVQSIKTQLVMAGFAQDNRVIGLTSARSGEGKSTIAANLALLFSHPDRRTLLIDADIFNPTLSRLLDVPAGTGLSDVLTGQCAFDEALVELAGSHLTVLTGGQSVAHADVLGSHHMRELLDTARQTFDRVIVDLPPVGEVVSTREVTPFIDGTVLVATWRKTQVGVLEETLKVFEFDRSKVFGVVLNKTAIGRPRSPPHLCGLPEPPQSAGHRMRAVPTGPVDRGSMATVAAGALFVFAVSGPGSSRALGIDGVERAFWAAADVLTGLALLQGRGRIGDLALGNPSLLAWPISGDGVVALVADAGAQPLSGPAAPDDRARRLLALLALRYALCSWPWFWAWDSANARPFLVPRSALGLGAIAEDGTWIGVYPHKNVLGSMMVLQIITCGVLIIDGRNRRLAIGLIAPGVRSASRVALGNVAARAQLCRFAVLPLSLCYRRGTEAFGICIGLAILGGAALAGVLTNGGNLSGAVLGQLGKDDTLTGRTVLWQFGFDQIHATPVIGIGYKAYWESSATSAAYLRYVVGQDLWFFHNNFVDVGVAFGCIGLFVFCWGLFTAVVRSFAIMARDTELLLLWRPMFVVYVIVEATAECPLFQNHSLHQLLLAVAMTWPAAAAVLPRRRAAPVAFREATS